MRYAACAVVAQDAPVAAESGWSRTPPDLQHCRKAATLAAAGGVLQPPAAPLAVRP
jgi:hypothetical protein